MLKLKLQYFGHLMRRVDSLEKTDAGRDWGQEEKGTTEVGDAIQPSHPLSSPSPPVLNLAQHQGLFQLVSSSHQVAKVLEFQLQHQSFQ